MIFIIIIIIMMMMMMMMIFYFIITIITTTTTSTTTVLLLLVIGSLSNDDGNVNENVGKTMDKVIEYNHCTWECNHLSTFPPSSLETEHKNLNSRVL